jgi:transcriptional regulator with XRE-family HTH domain
MKNYENRIKEEREYKGMTLKKLSEKTGLTAAYLSFLENGRRQNPSKNNMQNIASALDSTVQEIFFPPSKK